MESLPLPVHRGLLCPTEIPTDPQKNKRRSWAEVPSRALQTQGVNTFHKKIYNFIHDILHVVIQASPPLTWQHAIIHADQGSRTNTDGAVGSLHLPTGHARVWANQLPSPQCCSVALLWGAPLQLLHYDNNHSSQLLDYRYRIEYTVCWTVICRLWLSPFVQLNVSRMPACGWFLPDLLSCSAALSCDSELKLFSYSDRSFLKNSK